MWSEKPAQLFTLILHRFPIWQIGEADKIPGCYPEFNAQVAITRQQKLQKKQGGGLSRRLVQISSIIISKDFSVAWSTVSLSTWLLIQPSPYLKQPKLVLSQTHQMVAKHSLHDLQVGTTDRSMVREAVGTKWQEIAQAKALTDNQHRPGLAWTLRKTCLRVDE